MSCDFLSLALPGVQKLSPYVPGKPVEELAREFGLDPASIVKLASNENPLGPAPSVLQAVQRALPELTRYPDGNGFTLKQALSERFGFELSRITLGNGSNDVLELIGRAFAMPGVEVVFSQHAFAVYPIVTQAVGATAVQVPARNWGHDLPAMAAAITPATRLVFIANPNNPTGTWFERAEFEAFMASVPEHVLVVLDEAYTEYVEPGEALNGFDYIERYPNLIVCRTLSKAYGLAALRVGYCISHPQVADVLNRVRQPFNVNSLALAAAVAALADESYLAESRQLNRDGMRQLEQGLNELGLQWIPSRGNFIAVDLGRDAGPVYQGLLRAGVIVRPVAGYEMPNHLRVSIGLREENQRFLEALAGVLAQ
ncbi:MAG: histidinol-phosphate transaminase [Pseudomonadaceae bacterium]|jgi:histidinol-phosphate aminotransferase|uniref:Histidinol-phosphate aminotransferase n=1 Tax=Halopseudomonas formosensis TaxID=1002526 RepID=A0A1I6B1T7_9GAMM|nr:histidinol-phosphate transaminase [Halopseudomonas formosensis]MDY3197422.1 histidinol-phosphate transaminase [Pseudomonadaceae bacterium]SFQ74869.1 histidinol-phosphate aminotransferase [Halopseudomonas formosensis]